MCIPVCSSLCNRLDFDGMSSETKSLPFDVCLSRDMLSGDGAQMCLCHFHWFVKSCKRIGILLWAILVDYDVGFQECQSQRFDSVSLVKLGRKESGLVTQHNVGTLRTETKKDR